MIERVEDSVVEEERGLAQSGVADYRHGTQDQQPPEHHISRIIKAIPPPMPGP